MVVHSQEPPTRQRKFPFYFVILQKNNMTNNTTVTLDDVILNDGDIAAQTTKSQIHSNITIDAATLRDKGPRKPFVSNRPPRPAGSFSGTGTPRHGSNNKSTGDK